MRFRNGICALFIFSLTASALAEKLNVAELPHIHYEIIKPKISTTSARWAGSASGGLTVSVADQLPEMKDRIRTTLAW